MKYVYIYILQSNKTTSYGNQKCNSNVKQNSRRKSKTKQSGWSLGWFMDQGFRILPIGESLVQMDFLGFQRLKGWLVSINRVILSF